MRHLRWHNADPMLLCSTHSSRHAAHPAAQCANAACAQPSVHVPLQLPVIKQGVLSLHVCLIVQPVTDV